MTSESYGIERAKYVNELRLVFSENYAKLPENEITVVAPSKHDPSKMLVFCCAIFPNCKIGPMDASYNIIDWQELLDHQLGPHADLAFTDTMIEEFSKLTKANVDFGLIDGVPHVTTATTAGFFDVCDID